MSVTIPKTDTEVKTQYENNSDTNAFTDAEKTLLGNQSGTNTGDQTGFSTTFSLSGDISPSQITANQNDYNPTDLATSAVLRLNSDASRNITGLQGGADGRVLVIHNVGSNDIVLTDEDVNSTAANRFALTADATLSADQMVLLQYDSTSSRWRMISGGGGGSSLWETSGGNTQLVTADDIDFQKYKAIAMVCDNGATLPSTPATGQWYLHTPTGRNVLMMYDGSNWIPILNLGSTTIYVDGTSGTDDLDNGGASGASAFATIQYAVDSLAGLIGGNVTINIASGTYSENVSIGGKNTTGDYEIKLEGPMTTEASKAGIDSETATTFTDTGAFTGLTLTGMLIEFTKSGEDTQYNIVKSHTDDTITIAGQHDSAVDDTWDYEILSWDTVIQGDSSSNYAIQVYCDSVNIFKVDFTNDSTVNIFGIQIDGATTTIQASTYDAAANNNRFAILVYRGGVAKPKGCYLSQANNSATYRPCGLVSEGAILRGEDNWWHGAGGAGDGITIQSNSGWTEARSLYSHWDMGIRITSSSGSRLNTGSTSKLYVENCTTGMYAETNGCIVNGTQQNFSSNTTDTNTATGGQIT